MIVSTVEIPQPCAVLINVLPLAQCHNELNRLPVNEFDVFAGIERSKIDVKNPLPSRCVLPLCRVSFTLRCYLSVPCRYTRVCSLHILQVLLLVESEQGGRPIKVSRSIEYGLSFVASSVTSLCSQIFLRFLCAENEQGMLRIMAALVKAKVVCDLSRKMCQ